MHKACRGFSFIELLIALGLFAIVTTVALASLIQAGRNMATGEAYYRGQLMANSIALVARDAILDGVDPVAQAIARAYEGQAEFFSLWVTGNTQVAYHASGVSETHHIVGGNLLDGVNGYTVVVAVWCPDGILKGQGVAIAIP